MTNAARRGRAIALPMTTTLQTGPAPRAAPKRDKRGPMRRHFDAMRPGEWERHVEPDELLEKRIRVHARAAGCDCYWEDGTRNLIVKKKGRAK